MRWSEAGYLSRIVLTHAPRQAPVSLILHVRQNQTNMQRTPHFKAHIRMTFEQREAAFPRKFGFDAEGHRRLPLQMEGVEGLHTVGLWTEKKNQTLLENDEFDADCAVIWEEGFRSVVAPGVRFKLWDSGFIADGVVTERIGAGWSQK